ncbi:hypothetical protein JQT66_14215 [Sulfitobacter mediterraneus]|uniref:hypothetical protein n=1 Tax=Sulfitobacter mediterraneus TaxID=83219 RepID=UPI001931251E|nr:hypothetical protein [Sulfitobacter mediterraneus]MBM1311394.1 hypothetical protein [Sulfitobacter mediterraneus]MBM1315276.1 hypothetical protein [Sulfitobacter mediterraneus]MBM1323637.1 hypothetical protein [Sulfitobacter mediterraneus]MBM1327549.1 hypothetical protein [Sulfitobacter mediterraneus]MBM1398897.1 hypothetical protein [Sulfitobacter mediterraneus]
MLKKLCLVALLASLAACGDPLRNLDRLSDVDLAETEPVAQALPTEDEIAREGFLGTTAADPATNTAAQLQPADPAPEKRGGLLGLLRRVVPNTDPAPQDTAALAPVVLDAEPAPQTPVEQTTTVLETTPEDPATDAPILLASLTPTEEPPRKRAGLFARIAAPKKDKPRTGPDATDVPYGTVLPYGVIARVCEARRKPMGRKVEKANARGFALFDSNPDSAAPRTFYLTGFPDGCPRQLTAASVLLGAPSFYEQLHYGPAGKHLAYGDTDKAYEKVKSRVCGARKGKPCGSKIGQLEKSTFFVNTYERLGGNARWSELLIHNGEVLAASLKSND